MNAVAPRPRRLDTPRLVLRPLTLADHAAFHDINTIPAVRRYLFDDRVLEAAESRAMLARSIAQHDDDGLGLFGISLRPVHARVGWAGYLRHAPGLEIVYALLPPYWGRAIAVEACRAVMTWGVRHAGLTEFHSSVDVPNCASIRVLEKLGFRETRRTGALIHFALDASRLDQSNVTCLAAG